VSLEPECEEGSLPLFYHLSSSDTLGQLGPMGQEGGRGTFQVPDSQALGPWLPIVIVAGKPRTSAK
jgi:hypothetical protein